VPATATTTPLATLVAATSAPPAPAVPAAPTAVPPASPDRAGAEAPSLGSEPDFDALDIDTTTKFNKSDAFYDIWKREHIVDATALPLPEPWFDDSSSVLLTMSPQLPVQATSKADLLLSADPPVMVELTALSGLVHDAPTPGPAGAPAPANPTEQCSPTCQGAGHPGDGLGPR
jgi:hypothetical protein